MGLKDRIYKLRKNILKKTMDDFGKSVGLSKQAISQVESGKSNLSEVAIKSICREYGVREEWLREGTGDIFVKKSAEDELDELARKVMSDTPDSFRRRFVSMLAKLSDEQWKVLSDMEDLMLSAKPETSSDDSRNEALEQLHADLDREIEAQKKVAEKSTGLDSTAV